MLPPLDFSAVFRPVCLGFLLMGLAHPAAAQDFILSAIAESPDQLDVAVLPFTGVEDAGLDPATARPEAVLRSDLDFSGRFRLRQPPEGADPVAWADTAGVAAMTMGRLRRLPDGQIEANFELRAPGGALLHHRTVTGEPAVLRRLVHRFADDVVFQLFGERGIASTRIAYVRAGPEGKHIRIIDVDGFGDQPLSARGGIHLSPAWDGDHAVIYTRLGEGGAELLRQELGGAPRRLFPGFRGMHHAADVSLIDGEIVFAGSIEAQNEILRGLPGARTERLTFAPSIETSPSWSPTGSQIAFTSDRTGSPQIYVVDREGAGLRRVSRAGSYNDQVAWSPRGDRLAWVRMAGGFQIVTADLDGGDERAFGPGEQPNFSPDGRFLVFSSRRGGTDDLWIARADGQGMRQLTHSGGASQPCWSP